MARPRTQGLTDYELMIMQVLWKTSPLTVAEILELLPKRPKPAYTSLLTTLTSMEKKGHILHTKGVKAYAYLPALKQEVYQRSQLKRFIDGVYEGDPVRLAVNLVKHEKLGTDDVERLKKLLEEL